MYQVITVLFLCLSLQVFSTITQKMSDSSSNILLSPIVTAVAAQNSTTTLQVTANSAGFQFQTGFNGQPLTSLVFCWASPGGTTPVSASTAAIPDGFATALATTYNSYYALSDRSTGTASTYPVFRNITGVSSYRQTQLVYAHDTAQVFVAAITDNGHITIQGGFSNDIQTRNAISLSGIPLAHPASKLNLVTNGRDHAIAYRDVNGIGQVVKLPWNSKRKSYDIIRIALESFIQAPQIFLHEDGSACAVGIDSSNNLTSYRIAEDFRTFALEALDTNVTDCFYSATNSGSTVAYQKAAGLFYATRSYKNTCHTSFWSSSMLYL